jgi:hypothetical protein
MFKGDRMSADGITWFPVVDVFKFDQEQTEWVTNRSGVLQPQHQQFIDLNVEPYEVTHAEGNMLTTSGLTRLTALLTGTGQAMINTSTRLGVGDSAAAEAVGQTGLQAATNKLYKVMDATFPSASGAVITAKSSFQTGEANWVWNEWGLDIGAPTVVDSTTPATLFNRKVASLGTKASGVWALTVTVTFS